MIFAWLRSTLVDPRSVFSTPFKQMIIRGTALFILFLAACREPGLACDDPLGCIEIQPNEPVQIAGLLDSSGSGKTLGESAQMGIELAIADLSGGLLNHQIELVLVDSGCSLNTGQQAANLILENTRIVGVIGPICTEAADGALPALSRLGVVIISPANSAAHLTQPEEHLPGYFRTAFSNTQEGRIAAEFAFQALSARTAAIIFDNSRYADELQTAFGARFQELGGNITFRSRRQIEATSVEAMINNLVAGKPDVLFMPVFAPEAGLLVNKIAGGEDFSNTTLVGTDGLLLAEFASSAGPAAKGMYLAGPAVSGPEYEDYLSRWEIRFGAPPNESGFPGHVFAYDAANILFAAVMQAAQADSAGRLLIGRNALRQAVAKTTRFQGITGLLTCSPTGDCAADTAVGIYQLTDAEIQNRQWPPSIYWQPEPIP